MLFTPFYIFLLYVISVFVLIFFFFFFSSRRRHTRLQGDWSSDVCSSDLEQQAVGVDVGEAPAVAVGHLIIVGRIGVQDGAARQDEGAGEEAREIGRASCRERV